MDYLEVECLKCGCQFTIMADEIETEKEYFCPGCSLKIDDRQWRKMRIGFFAIAETADRLEGPVLDVRLFRAQFQRPGVDLGSLFGITNNN